MRRPPKWVQGFVDRSGRARWYFRRRGYPRTPLRGLPWSPDFMASYERALGDQPEPIGQIGASRSKPGTMRALAASYLGSPAFLALRASSQRAYRSTIDAFIAEHGDRRAAELQREHVVRLISARADRPGAANHLRKILRLLMQHAVEIGLRADDPTVSVKAVKTKSSGYHSWEEHEIARFEACHAVGTRARLMMALLLYTGQRVSDVLQMGKQHVREEFLRLRQQKTGTDLHVPVHPTLREIIDQSPCGDLTFVIAGSGTAFTPGAFSQAFRRYCREAGLPHCSAHGLRKACARRLAEAGCTAHEIAAITGHASLAEVTRYTKAADQKRLAAAAMAKGRTKIVKLDDQFDKARKKS
jgi:integrase